MSETHWTVASLQPKIEAFLRPVLRRARLSLDFDGRYGSTTGPWTTDMFIEAVYRSLQEKK